MANSILCLRKAVLPSILLAAAAMPGTAQATVTFYSGSNSFGFVNHTNSTTVLNLDSLAPVNSFVSYGSPGSVNLGPLTVSSNGPLFAQNNNLWLSGGYLSAQQLTGATVTFSFDDPTTAFGFFYGAGEPFTITVEGQSTTLPGGTYPPFVMSFVGVTSDTPFSSISLTLSGNGIDMDSLRLASLNVDSVPEPATWMLMLLGFGAIGTAMRRSRPALLPQIA